MTEPTDPPENDERSHIVRLVVKVDADDASDAVLEFVDVLIASGLRNWAYRVESLSGEVEGYFDGYGNPVDIDSLTPKIANRDDEDDLEAFAESLGDVQGSS